MLLSWLIFTCLFTLIFGNSPNNTLEDEIPPNSEASIGKFLHIVVGEVLFVKLENMVIFRSDLRNLFPNNQDLTKATIRTAPFYSESTICEDKAYVCATCSEFHNVVAIREKDQIKSHPMIIQLPPFDISQIKSLQIDLRWTKICTNLTHLPDGAFTANAMLKDYHVASARNMTEIKIREYPITGHSELVIKSSEKSIKQLYLYDRPIDGSITSSPPCSESVIGQKRHPGWMKGVMGLLKTLKNGSVIVKIGERLLTSPNGILGSTFLIETEKSAACGAVKFESNKILNEKVTYGAIFEGKVQAWMKLTQPLPQNSAFVSPIAVTYYIEEDEKSPKMHEKPKAYWDIVTSHGYCKNAVPFDPFRIIASTKTMECEEDSYLCPLGLMSKRYLPLKVGVRKHTIVEDLPLKGMVGDKLSGYSIRIKTQDGHLECAPLERWQETPFRFLAKSSRTLEDIQKEIASKINVKNMQVSIEYTRELYKDFCSIYSVVLTANQNSTEHFLASYDLVENQFIAAPRIPCSKGEKIEEITKKIENRSLSRFYVSLPIVLHACLLQWLL